MSQEKRPPAETRRVPSRMRVVGPELSEDERQASLMATSSVFNATAVMHPMQKNLAGDKATSDGVMVATDVQVQKVQAGDLSEVEAMLMAQAMALESTFASLMRRAVNQDLLEHYQAFMTLGLKAQAQSRATLQALIEMKQPRHAATFIRQANVAHGHQQVNNGVMSGPKDDAGPLSPAGKSEDVGNKLLEVQHGEWLESGAPAAASRVDPHLAAVDKVHRPKD